MRSLMMSLMLLVSLTVCEAKTVELRPKKPVASVDIPSGWDISTANRGIGATSPNEKIQVWVEYFKSDEISAVIKENLAYFDDRGIKILGAETTEKVRNGVKIRVTTFSAQYENKSTELYNIDFDFNLPSQNRILITYWGDPDTPAKLVDEASAIVASLEITEKP